MLRIIENPKFCNKMCIDGCYFQELQEIIVADRNNKGVLVHELSHHLWDKGDTDYLDMVLGICALLEIDFFDVVNVAEVSTLVDDYEVMLDEIMAYFVEQVYLDFPDLVLGSHPVYRIVLERDDNDE